MITLKFKNTNKCNKKCKKVKNYTEKVIMDSNNLGESKYVSYNEVSMKLGAIPEENTNLEDLYLDYDLLKMEEDKNNSNSLKKVMCTGHDMTRERGVRTLTYHFELMAKNSDSKSDTKHKKYSFSKR